MTERFEKFAFSTICAAISNAVVVDFSRNWIKPGWNTLREGEIVDFQLFANYISDALSSKWGGELETNLEETHARERGSKGAKRPSDWNLLHLQPFANAISIAFLP